jgi:hypothetical protein
MSANRRACGGGVVAALLVLAAVGRGEDDAPAPELDEKAALRAMRKAPARPARLYLLPRRVDEADVVRGATSKVGGEPLVLYDVDGNGDFTDVGVDAWRVDAGGLSYALPVEPEIVLDGERYRIAADTDAGVVRFARTAAAWPEGVKADRETRKEIETALRTWNVLRMRNGLLPVHLDAELTQWCLEHARYMQKHGVTHDQDPEHPEHTEGGARVARSGSVGSLAAAAEIVAVYSTFYHRISLFHPGTRGAGIGTTGARSVLNGTENRVERSWTWPVIVPAPDTEQVPRSYYREKPVPHIALWRDGTIDEAGFPVTLTFERDAITDVTAELRVDDHEGRRVPFSLSWPERPASSDAPTNYKTICLLPHAPLRARTTYWVHVEWTYRGEIDQRTWTFRTGK